MLRKLDVGEEVMVLKPYSAGSSYSVGDVGKYVGKSGGGDYCLVNVVGDEPNACVKRENLLAVGDKVEILQTGTTGIVIWFAKPTNKDWGEWKVEGKEAVQIGVEVDGKGPNYYQMTPKKQDLKLTGDSDLTDNDDGGKPECFGEYPCIGVKGCTGCPSYTGGGGKCKCMVCQHGMSNGDGSCKRATEADTDKPITDTMEDTMTRAQRATKKEEEIKSLKEVMAADAGQFKDKKAQDEEKLNHMANTVSKLRRFKTDQEADIALVKAAKNLDNKTSPDDQAAALLELAEREIKV